MRLTIIVVLHLATSVDAFRVCSARLAGNWRLYSAAPRSDDDLSSVLTSRLPTSVEDQVRQASESLRRASADNIHRHCVRLLLPVIGATELDDWPGGARQMMEAACPLMESVLRGIDKNVNLSRSVIDASDGVGAIMAQGEEPKDDSCTVLLPSADNISTLLDLDQQVGPRRNLIVANPQWKRQSDFGGNIFFGNGGKNAEFAESFVPSFSLTNLICEGEAVRILRLYPGPWRVFMRKDLIETGQVDWIEIGQKQFVHSKPANWSQQPENQQDGGRLFDYGQPSYQDIIIMLGDSPNYKPKGPAERAQAAFNFIKDTL